jgi:hypothetical protein
MAGRLPPLLGWTRGSLWNKAREFWLFQSRRLHGGGAKTPVHSALWSEKARGDAEILAREARQVVVSAPGQSEKHRIEQ